MNSIKVSVINGDAFKVKADILVLKFAQVSHGLDREIVRRFEALGEPIDFTLLRPWRHYITESRAITNTKNILFIGVPTLNQFGYKEIREFGRTSLKLLASLNPYTKSIITTIHGANYGLDEMEAFESQIAGVVDSITAGSYPSSLEEIIFVEYSVGRSQRLQNILNTIFPTGNINTSKSGEIKNIGEHTAETLRSAGYGSQSKKNVFVAMPFASEFDDCFHYGIQGAVKNAGYLCERADLQSFTGDVMEWVKSRISSADFVIADLTTANPNVYLEVGYAWGQNRKTILLIKDTNELKFDTRGQRCLTYTSIKELETKLKKEIEGMFWV